MTICGQCSKGVSKISVPQPILYLSIYQIINQFIDIYRHAVRRVRFSVSCTGTNTHFSYENQKENRLLLSMLARDWTRRMKMVPRVCEFRSTKSADMWTRRVGFNVFGRYECVNCIVLRQDCSSRRRGIIGQIITGEYLKPMMTGWE